jgi:hypothetical protein
VDNLSGIGNDISFANISNGFIQKETSYINLDRKKTIDTVTVEAAATAVLS